jgi:hypothetical protein
MSDDRLEKILRGEYVEPDVVVTEGDCFAEGIYVRVDADLIVSDGVAALYPDPAERAAFARSIRDKYRAGVYADPPEVDEHGEAAGWLALYRVAGVEYWAQPQAGSLVIYLPEEY